MTAKELRQQIETSGSIAFVPKGDSMWPIIKNNSKTVLIKKKEGRLCTLDVGMYERKSGKIALHRVKEVLVDGYIFQGDSQTETEKINEESVFGVFAGYFTKKKFVNANNEKYVLRVKKWMGKRDRNCLRLKFFNLKKRVKAKLKRTFRKKEED